MKFYDQLVAKWQNLTNQTKTIFLAVGFIALAALSFLFEKKPVEPTAPPAELQEIPVAADTYIPKNHVLVPIEISNQESLSALLGSYGIVDLFAAMEDSSRHPNNSGRGQKLASRVKIIRAPLNPQKFAVLIHENLAQRIVGHAGSFFVVVQNPQASGEAELAPEQQRPKALPTLEISYQN